MDRQTEEKLEVQESTITLDENILIDPCMPNRFSYPVIILVFLYGVSTIYDRVIKIVAPQKNFD